MEEITATRAEKCLLAIFAFMALFALLLIAFVCGRDYGKKHGQIDAINGKIYYELQEMDNGEMQWRRIEEE